MMNYFSKWSEVHLKINFVIGEMKVYFVMFLLLNIHEALQVYLIWTQASTSLICYAYLIFSTKTTGLP